MAWKVLAGVQQLPHQGALLHWQQRWPNLMSHSHNKQYASARRDPDILATPHRKLWGQSERKIIQQNLVVCPRSVYYSNSATS